MRVCTFDAALDLKWAYPVSVPDKEFFLVYLLSHAQFKWSFQMTRVKGLSEMGTSEVQEVIWVAFEQSKQNCQLYPSCMDIPSKPIKDISGNCH